MESLIYKEIIEIIHNYHNFEDIFQMLIETYQSDENIFFIIEIIENYLDEECKISGCSKSYISASYLASQIKKLFSSLNPIKNSLKIPQNKLMDIILNVGEHLVNRQCFEESTFLNIILEGCCLPLIFLWQLHKRHIINIESFILSSKISFGQTDLFISDFNKILSLDVILSEDLDCISNVAVILINIAYGPNIDLKSKKIAINILDRIFTDYFSLSSFNVNLFGIILMNNNTNSNVCSKLLKRQLNIFLTSETNIKITEVISNQYKWMTDVIYDQYLNLFKEICKVISADDGFNIVKLLFMNQRFNWRNFMYYLNSCLQYYDDKYSNNIKDLITDSIKLALESMQVDDLQNTIILARTSFFTDKTLTYCDWFKGLFTDDIISDNNYKSFKFFIDTCTNLVPFEQTEYLKAHIHSNIKVSNKNGLLWNDYIHLAKTRLKDLECVGDQKSGFEKNSVKQNKIKLEIERALYIFETSSKIPSAILELSIFKKSYFINSFLPYLLQPQTISTLSKTKLSFLEALISAKMLTQQMFNEYIEACKQLETDFLSGIFVEIDNCEMEDVLLSNEDQLKNVLKLFQKQILTNSKEIENSLTIIKEKLNYWTYFTNPIILDHQLSGINLDDFIEIDLLSSKISHTFIELICQTTFMQIETKSFEFDWIENILFILKSCNHLFTCFIVVYINLFKGSDHPHIQHYFGLALILICLNKNDKSFYIYQNVKKNFQDIVVNSLSLRTRKSMLSSYYMSLAYLKCLCVTLKPEYIDCINFNQIIPVYFFEIIYFVGMRISPLSFNPNTNEDFSSKEKIILNEILSSPSFKMQLSPEKILFKKMIEFELQIVEDDLDVFENQKHLQHLVRSLKPMCILYKQTNLNYCTDIVEAIILNQENPSSNSCSKCDVSFKQKNNKIITLIQLINDLCNVQDLICDHAKPWIWECIENTIPYTYSSIDSHIQHSVNIHINLINTVNLLQLIPQYLFLSQLSIKFTSTNTMLLGIKCLTKFINNGIRDYVAIHLPRDFCLKVLQVFQLISSEYILKIFKAFVHNCPIFLLTVFKFWSYFEQSILEQENTLMKHLKELQCSLLLLDDRCFSMVLSYLEHSKDINPLLLTFLINLVDVTQCKIEGSKSSKLHDLMKQLNEDPNYFAYDKMMNKNLTLLFHLSLSQIMIRCLPLILLQCLTCMVKFNFVIKLIAQPAVVTHLIDMFNHVSQNFYINIVTSADFSLDCLSKIEESIIQIIGKMSFKDLKLISREVISHADIRIQALFYNI